MNDNTDNLTPLQEYIKRFKETALRSFKDERTKDVALSCFLSGIFTFHNFMNTMDNLSVEEAIEKLNEFLKEADAMNSCIMERYKENQK